MSGYSSALTEVSPMALVPTNRSNDLITSELAPGIFNLQLHFLALSERTELAEVTLPHPYETEGLTNLFFFLTFLPGDHVVPEMLCASFCNFCPVRKGIWYCSL